jgi:uncharacterized protein YggU (UPF0235/DUF167 family)
LSESVAIPVIARPGAADEAISWDPWRRSWHVRVTARPTGGAANRAILEALARWLDVPPAQVRWRRAGADRSKVAEVEGLSHDEVDRRLARAAGARPLV